MNIIQTYQNICTNLLSQKVEVVLADLEKANRIVDQLKEASFPVLVVIPYNVEDNKAKSGLLKSVIPFEGFMLTRIPQPTVDFKHIDIETEAIQPMRILAREFVAYLNTYTDPETEGITKVTYFPVYSSMDANLHGVDFKFSFPVIESEPICLNLEQ